MFFCTAPLVKAGFFKPRMCPDGCHIIGPNGLHADFGRKGQAQRHLIPKQLCRELAIAICLYANVNSSNLHWKKGRPFKKHSSGKDSYIVPTAMARRHQPSKKESKAAATENKAAKGRGEPVRRTKYKE